MPKKGEQTKLQNRQPT